MHAGVLARTHDPLSQRAYMWNNNNPYMYEDPSGYDPRADAIKLLLKVIEKAIEHKSDEDLSQHKFASKEKLDDHFNRHGDEFRSQDAKSYQKAASEFYSDPKALAKVSKDGTLRMYDPDSNTFASYSKDGTIKTFFKPKDDGLEYWKSQPGVLVAPPGFKQVIPL